MVKRKLDKQRKDIIEWAASFLPERFPFINEIWLYGSCARGDFGPFSDIDILCCIEEDYFVKNVVREIRTQYPECLFGPDLDIHLCVNKLSDEKNDGLYIKNIRKDGIKIYG